MHRKPASARPPARLLARRVRPRLSPGFRLVAGALGPLVLLLSLLAASPHAHAALHHDAHAPGHHCAVTLAQAGFCDTSAPPPVVEAAPAFRRAAPAEGFFFSWTPPSHWHEYAHGPPPARS